MTYLAYRSIPWLFTVLAFIHGIGVLMPGWISLYYAVMTLLFAFLAGWWFAYRVRHPSGIPGLHR